MPSPAFAISGGVERTEELSPPGRGSQEDEIVSDFSTRWEVVSSVKGRWVQVRGIQKREDQLLDGATIEIF